MVMGFCFIKVFTEVLSSKALFKEPKEVNILHAFYLAVCCFAAMLSGHFRDYYSNELPDFFPTPE